VLPDVKLTAIINEGEDVSKVFASTAISHWSWWHHNWVDKVWSCSNACRALEESLQVIFQLAASWGLDVLIGNELVNAVQTVMAWIEEDHWLWDTRANGTGTIMEGFSW
jgi:hypothetical protein